MLATGLESNEKNQGCTKPWSSVEWLLLNLLSAAATVIRLASWLHWQHSIILNRFADRDFYFTDITLFQRYRSYISILLTVGDWDVALDYWFIVVPAAGVRVVVGVAAVASVVVPLLPVAIVGGQTVGVPEARVPRIGTAAPLVVGCTGIPVRLALILSPAAARLILGHVFRAGIHLAGLGALGVVAPG